MIDTVVGWDGIVEDGQGDGNGDKAENLFHISMSNESEWSVCQFSKPGHARTAKICSTAQDGFQLQIYTTAHRIHLQILSP